MGFTHYFYRDIDLDKDKFAKAAADCKKVAEYLEIPIQYEYNEAKMPVFADELIRFNGVDEDGHETFVVEQKFSIGSYESQDDDGKYFSFCKTARKPYDTVVVACLIILKHYFGEDLRLSSDGYAEEWEEGLRAVKECLGYGEVPSEIPFFNARYDQ